jgi:hypothetical protein
VKDLGFLSKELDLKQCFDASKTKEQKRTRNGNKMKKKTFIAPVFKKTLQVCFGPKNHREQKKKLQRMKKNFSNQLKSFVALYLDVKHLKKKQNKTTSLIFQQNRIFVGGS